MRASDPEVVDAVRAAVEPLLVSRVRSYPLGCHRPRIPDRVWFSWGLLIRTLRTTRASGTRPCWYCRQSSRAPRARAGACSISLRLMISTFVPSLAPSAAREAGARPARFGPIQSTESRAVSATRRRARPSRRPGKNRPNDSPTTPAGGVPRFSPSACLTPCCDGCEPLMEG